MIHPKWKWTTGLVQVFVPLIRRMEMSHFFFKAVTCFFDPPFGENEASVVGSQPGS